MTDELNNQQTNSQQPAGATQNPPAGTNQPNQAQTEQSAAAKGTTLYADAGLNEPGKGDGKDANGVWPGDWKDQFSKFGPDGKTKAFERFASPADLAKSYMALQQRISSGEFKRNSPMPDGKDQALVDTWRTENNLPVKVEDYNILPAEVKADKLDPASKAVVGEFQKLFHGANLSQDAASGLAKGIFEYTRRDQEAKTMADAQARDGIEDTLRAEWGPDYRNNFQTNIAHMTKQFGNELTPLIFEARLPDGRLLGNVPEFSKVINQWARSEGGDDLVDLGSSGGKGGEERIKEIESWIAAGDKKYTNAIGEEYGKLIDRREARKARG